MKRIPVIIALFLAVPLIAQTSKPVPASQTTFISDCSTHPEACISTTPSFVMNPVDEHGCRQFNGYQWDESVKGCAITVTFSSDETSPLTCKITARDSHTQTVTCWYTPAPAKTPEPAK